jgi:hypothetical protein
MFRNGGFELFRMIKHRIDINDSKTLSKNADRVIIEYGALLMISVLKPLRR